MDEVIDLKTQQQIVSTIKALCTRHGDREEEKKQMAERAHLLFTGVYIGLGSRTPPHWVVNIHAHATDRMLKDGR